MATTDDIPLQSMGGRGYDGGNVMVTDAQVHIDMEGTEGGYPKPTASDGQPRYRKHRTKSSSEQRGGHPSTSRRPVSYHGDKDLADQLMMKLPSRQLADQVKSVLADHTLRKKGHKRRPGYYTLRHHGEVQAAVAAAQLEQGDEDFLDKSIDEQADVIKNQYPSASLAEKKAIKAEVQQRRKKKEKRPGVYKRMKYSLSLSWKRFRVNLAELAYSTELWRTHFKTIEGQFGTSVTSYFRFIKWLFLLNIPVFLLTFAFVVTPQLLYRYHNVTDPYKDNLNFSAEQILTGGGWLNGTELYYGAYTKEVISIIPGHEYHMQYAYILTTFGYYFLILIVTMISLSRSYRRNYIESSQEFDFYYVTKVFSGWDYSINNPRSAILKHKSLFKEFQEYLAGFRKDEEKQDCSASCGLFTLRVFTNILVLGLLGGSAYLVWYISVTQSLGNDIAFLMEMALPLCISAINFILPFAFSILATFEKYKSPQVELYITMLRTIVLNVCTLGVLIYFWFSSVDCSKREANEEKWLNSELECRPCWETFMGEQIYRLVIVDFIFVLVVTFISEFIRRLMSQFCCKSLGYPEFNIGRNTLNLIYSQILIWVGTFYSPMLSFIQFVKLLIIFYVKRFSVTQNCVPSVKPWRGGRTHTFILALLFAAFLLCLFAVGFSIVFLTPSKVCGPYMGLDSSYQVLTDLFRNWQGANPSADNVLRTFLEIITSFFFIIALFLALCVIAHWSRVVALGHHEMTELLRHQISLEGKDKMFLLRLLKEALKKMPNPVQPYRSGIISSNVVSPASPKSPGRVFAKTRREEKEQFLNSYASEGSSLNQIPSPRPIGNNNYSKPHQTTEPEVYNPGFMDNSQEFQNEISRTVPSMNPGFREKSPTSKPNLPYPGTHYMKPE